MDNKKSFILYLDALSVLDELDDKQAGKLFRAIKAYQLRSAERCEQDADTGFESLMEDFVTRIAFAPFKAQFERDNQRYDELVERQRENGKKGGAPKGNQNAKKNNPSVEKTTQTTQPLKKQPKQPYNDNDSDNDNDEEKYKKESLSSSSSSSGVFKDIKILKTDYLANERLCLAVVGNPRNGVKDKAHLEKLLTDFNLHLEQSGQSVKEDGDYKTHFLNWIKIRKEKQKTEVAAVNIPALKRF